MPTSNTTLHGAVLQIAEQLTRLIEYREELLAANTVPALDLALRAIADSSGVIRACASSLRFSAGFAEDRRNSGRATFTDAEPDRVTMRAVLRNRGLG